MSENKKIVYPDFANRTYTYGQDVKVSSTPQFDESITLHNQNLNNKGTINDKGVVSSKRGLNNVKTDPLRDMEQTYTKTEIDSKLDLVNQKVEHNQEKIELIVSKAMDNITYQITNFNNSLDTKIANSVKSLEEQIDTKLSKIESKVLYYVVGSLLVPLLVVVAPFTLKVLWSMLSTMFAGIPAATP